MPNMKYSGVEWIGNIPEEWNKVRLKDIYSFEKGRNAQMYTQEYIGQHEGKNPVFSGQTENEGIMGKINSYDYDLKECIFTTTVGAKCMTLKIISGKFSLSQNCLIMKQININININKYIYYSLLPLFEYEKSKIPSYMQPSLRIEDLNKYKLYLPSVNEQKLIVNFLDEKNSNLDKILFDLNKQLEIINNYKKALITETVTKGLNRNIKFKDSDIDYIGMIPEDWSCTKLKYVLSSNLTYGANESGEDFNDLYPRYIRITDIDENNMLKEEGKLSLLPETAKSYLLKENDILFARSGATVGKTFLYKEEYGKAAFAGYLIKATINNKIVEPKYVYYSTLGIGYENWKNSIFTQATIQNIAADKYSAYKIPFPPLEEQKEIVDYLDKKCKQIDKIVAGKQKQIQKIEDYKKSVIYEYVTGKKRVEGAEELYG